MRIYLITIHILKSYAFSGVLVLSTLMILDLTAKARASYIFGRIAIPDNPQSSLSNPGPKLPYMTNTTPILPAQTPPLVRVGWVCAMQIIRYAAAIKECKRTDFRTFRLITRRPPNWTRRPSISR